MRVNIILGWLAALTAAGIQVVEAGSGGESDSNILNNATTPDHVMLPIPNLVRYEPFSYLKLIIVVQPLEPLQHVASSFCQSGVHGTIHDCQQYLYVGDAGQCLGANVCARKFWRYDVCLLQRH